MPARPFQPGPQPADLFLGDHDGIESSIAQCHRETTELPNSIPDTREVFWVLRDQKISSILTSGLLVADDGQHDIPWRHQSLSIGAQQCRQHHRHTALHIEGPTPPDKTVSDLSPEWRMVPGLVGCRHHIHVTVHQERRGLSPSLQSRNQVWTCRVAGQNGRGDTSLGQQVPDEPDAWLLMAWGVSCVKRDQTLQERHGVTVVACRPIHRPPHRLLSTLSV